MDNLTFVVEMSKAWAWPVTIFALGVVLFKKWISLPR
jgi:hypothetical protein